MSILELSWGDVLERLGKYDNRGWKIYGVPKGGMIATAFLKNAIPVYDPEQADFILDDIVGSGETRDYYKARYPIGFVVLVDKQVEGLQGTWVSFPWERDHPAEQDDSVQQNITRMIEYLGEDPNRDGLKDTPNRVVKSWSELYKGYGEDPRSLIREFDADLEQGQQYDEIVLLKDIELYSACEHHMLPFFGKAHVAYLPGDKESNLLGISKLARLLEIYSRRLQIQERIGQQVTEFLMKEARAKGAACMIEAQHLCMQMRGVNKQNSIMITSSMKGVFLEDGQARSELMSLIK